jgi:hypothetical protein
MRTPVEEAGLEGQGLAQKVRAAIDGVPEAEMLALLGQLERRALERRLIYVRDGTEEPIRVLPVPIAALPEQLAYVRAATLALHGALKRLPDLYFADRDVRAALQLGPREEEWLKAFWSPQVREDNTVIGRHDAVIDFGSPRWQSTLTFLEPNLGGIGGLHLMPTADLLLAQVMLPALRRVDPDLHLELAQDIRTLLVQDLLDHAGSLGRPGRTLCFVEPKYASYGPNEQAALAAYCHEHFGIAVCHADPTELELAGDEVYYEGHAIDLVYRDYSVVDLDEICAGGADIAPMEALFRQNRVVSTVAAELDQKSCFEVLGSPELAHRHFSAEERRMFRRHIPWTRVVSDRRTSLPDGASGELLPFCERAREELVLKPNRGYGGEGVVLGAESPEPEWSALLSRALDDPERWVVQRLVEVPVMRFPVTGAAGELASEAFHVVLGFAPSTYGLATLGRASRGSVVNVAQRGGMCCVMVGHPTGRLL